MLDHLSIQCADLAASAAFYDAVLVPIGGQRNVDFGEVIGYGTPPRPDFWIGAQSTGDGFRESHIAFVAPSRKAVRAFVEAAVATGAEVLHEPHVFPEYHPNYYGGSSGTPTATTWRRSASSRRTSRLATRRTTAAPPHHRRLRRTCPVAT